MNSKRLLDQFLGTGAQDKLTEQLRGLGAGAGTGGSGGAGGMMQGKGGMATGALAGGLLALLVGSKKGRKLAGSAVKVGGLALVGGLAFNAYRNWQNGQTPQVSEREAPQAAIEAEQHLRADNTPFLPAPEADQDRLSRAVLRAMIAAAKADGHIDADERARIFQHIGALDLDADDRAFVMAELNAPLDIEAVAADVRSEEEAAEVYAASLLAIDRAGAAEKGYLALLAARLKLPADLLTHLHATVDGATEPLRV